MFDLLRVIAVVMLLGIAAAIATPRGRLPLALRGLQRTLGQSMKETAGEPVTRLRRLGAFFLVLVAIAVALV